MQPRKLHYISGVILFSFITVHLANHALLAWSVTRHLETMASLRRVYRHPVAETLVISAALVQVITGLRMIYTSRKLKATPVQRWKILSGIYLSFFLLVHISAVMAGRFLLHLDTNIYFAAVGVTTFPFAFFFIPYYSLSIIAIFVHIATVHYTKMKTTIGSLSPKMQSVSIVLLGIVLSGVIMFSILTKLSKANIPPGYYKVIGEKAVAAS